MARTFSWIYDAHQTYARALSDELRGGSHSMAVRKGRPPIVRFSHFFWAHHIRAVLAPGGVRTGFLRSHFSLVRTGHLGAMCAVNFNASARVEAILHSEREAERVFWRGPGANATTLEMGSGSWLVARQCPLRVHLAEEILCPWSSPACSIEPEWQARVRRSVAMCAEARSKASDA